MAFTVVFLVKTTSLSLVAVGAALTAGQLLALPVPPVLGPLLDKYGPRTVVAVGNWVSVAGFIGFLFSHASWQIVLWQFVVQLGSTAFWMGNSPLIVLVARGDERARWFGFIRALRNVGIGFGGAASAVALSIGTVDGLRAVMVINAVSFAVAGWLIITFRGADTSEAADAGHAEPRPAAPRPAEPKPAEPEQAAGERTGQPSGGYRTVLKDTRYLRLVATNIAFAFASTVITVLLAAYVADNLDVGSWIVGVLVVLNTAMVALLQTLASRWIEARRPVTVLVLALLFNAAAFIVFGTLLVLPGWAVIAGLLIAMVLYTVGEILGSPPTSELSVVMAPEHLRGRDPGRLPDVLVGRRCPRPGAAHSAVGGRCGAALGVPHRDQCAGRTARARPRPAGRGHEQGRTGRGRRPRGAARRRRRRLSMSASVERAPRSTPTAARQHTGRRSAFPVFAVRQSGALRPHAVPAGRRCRPRAAHSGFVPSSGRTRDGDVRRTAQ
ncbi:MFS transporter [Streptomyces sp. MS1.AVA.1]|uniref:MFS transporter n=1 Tax=Streptomyces machairae TaxID=3134109 RepID=A0ABU8UWE4_9ACTN